MKQHHIEEITLVMCECCYELRLEECCLELSGMSYCLACIGKYRDYVKEGRYEMRVLHQEAWT
jgi:hypothetical protein